MFKKILSLPELSMKTFAWCSIGLFFLIAAVDLLLGSTWGQSPGGKWLETKTSKAVLLEALPIQPDVILIGDSRTQYHFNTKVMAESGLSFFNFGMVGSSFEDVLSPVLMSRDIAQKTVVLNFSIADFKSPARCPKRPTRDEVDIIRKATGKICKFSELDELFQLSLIRNQKFLRKPVEYKIKRKKFQRYLTQFGGKTADFGRGINYMRGDNRGLTVTFENGDGLLFSNLAEHHKSYGEIKPTKIRRLHSDKITLLQALGSYYREGGKELILNLEVLQDNRPCELPDLGALESHMKIMRTCEKPYGDSYWSDVAHFNSVGVSLYNQDFLKRLKLLLP
jgi:hypothetical protein